MRFEVVLDETGAIPLKAFLCIIWQHALVWPKTVDSRFVEPVHTIAIATL
jgi:hypothetical protein